MMNPKTDPDGEYPADSIPEADSYAYPYPEADPVPEAEPYPDPDGDPEGEAYPDPIPYHYLRISPLKVSDITENPT